LNTDRNRLGAGMTARNIDRMLECWNKCKYFHGMTKLLFKYYD